MRRLVPSLLVVVLAACTASLTACDSCEVETALLPVSVTWAPAVPAVVTVCDLARDDCETVNVGGSAPVARVESQVASTGTNVCRVPAVLVVVEPEGCETMRATTAGRPLELDDEGEAFEFLLTCD